MTAPHDKALEIRDDESKLIKAGDRINFSYGIPGNRVDADIIDLNGELWALTPGHKPDRCKLSVLRRYVGHFWKTAKFFPAPPSLSEEGSDKL
ncbi:hypothetical protein G6L30_07920 [Agrobacterium rhizogenes]|nr:hypothetical protein [Rhizobium rhizogenes]